VPPADAGRVELAIEAVDPAVEVRDRDLLARVPPLQTFDDLADLRVLRMFDRPGLTDPEPNGAGSDGNGWAGTCCAT